MKRKGSLVWWSVSEEFETDGVKLEELGFGERAPRNDPRAALIKAIQRIKKKLGLESSGSVPKLRADHERFVDDAEKCSIAITRPRVIGEELDGYDILCTCTINKENGELETQYPHRHSHEFHDSELRSEYLRQRQVVSGRQFSDIVSRVITGWFGNDVCHGISMRPFSGGVYYVDKRFDERLQQIKDLFQAHDHCRFDSVPMFDNVETDNAIEFATTLELQNEIDRFEAKLEKEGRLGITQRVLDSRIERAQELVERIRIHSDRIQANAKDFLDQAEKTIQVLGNRVFDAKKNVVTPFDFVAEMMAIDNPKPAVKTEEVEEINREDVEAAAEKLDEIKESNNHKDMWDFGD